MVGHDLRDGRPVFEGPLRVEGALRPGYDRGLLGCHGVEVLKGVGDVLGVGLRVVEEILRDVEVHGVGEGCC